MRACDAAHATAAAQGQRVTRRRKAKLIPSKCILFSKIAHGGLAMKIEAFRFSDDGDVPNHPHWPMIVYQGALSGSERDAAAAFEDLFARNGWGDGWRNGIYAFPHYHSNAHEVLGIAAGEAMVRFGGVAGKELKVSKGDAVLLPAGTGHQRLSSSPDLLVIGAYPPGSGR